MSDSHFSVCVCVCVRGGGPMGRLSSEGVRHNAWLIEFESASQNLYLFARVLCEPDPALTLPLAIF